MAKKEY